jgi:hypothetical protein
VGAELSDLSQVESESKRLYGLLQGSVDREIQQTGFLPENNGNGHRPATNGNGNGNGSREEEWKCSSKQRNLILKIVEESRLEKNKVEALAQDRFGKSVRELNKLEASGLIEELLRQTGNNGQGGHNRFQKAGAR